MNYYAQNIVLLSKKAPELVDMVEQYRYPENLFVAKGQNGHLVLAKRENSGKTVLLSSPVDPTSEARTLLRNYSFGQQDGTVLFGFGLGNLTREIVQKKETGHILFVIEADPGLFKLAMTHEDLTNVLGDDHVLFSLGTDKSDIIKKFDAMKGKVISGQVGKLAMPTLMDLGRATYEDIDEYLDRHIRAMQHGFFSFNRMRERCMKNAFANLPSFVTSSKIEHLPSVKKGLPVVIVAAGPSLGENLAVLKKRQSEMIILAVDSAVKPLVEYGITPDMVVTCDPDSMNARKMAGLHDAVFEIPLLYQADGQPQVVHRFKKKKFIISPQNTFTGWLVKKTLGYVQSRSYQNVSHLGLCAAQMMGADPIVLVGLDLAFPGGKIHYEGCAETWRVTFEEDQPIRWVPSNDGGVVQTIDGFMATQHGLEMDILSSPGKVVNTSRNGALIRGADMAPLTAVPSDHSRKRLRAFKESFLFQLYNAPVELEKEAQISCRKALENILPDVIALLKISEKAKMMLHRYEGEKKWRQIEKLYQSAFNYGTLLDLLTDYLPGYMIACTTKKTENSGDRDTRYPDQKTMALFFGELYAILPYLQGGIISAIDDNAGTSL